MARPLDRLVTCLASRLQGYISTPLLVGGKKFDMRLYIRDLICGLSLCLSDPDLCQTVCLGHQLQAAKGAEGLLEEIKPNRE